MRTYWASTIAKWFLSWADRTEDGENDVTALKLQKLLYYAQGHHLATYGRPLFDDRIKAWSHGPVVPDIWHEYKAQGSGVIEAPASFAWDEVDPETTDFLVRVWGIYGSYSAWALRNKTHDEQPWQEAFARRRVDSSPEISRATMEKFFWALPSASERAEAWDETAFLMAASAPQHGWHQDLEWSREWSETVTVAALESQARTTAQQAE